jgi:hypothetical protein
MLDPNADARYYVRRQVQEHNRVLRQQAREDRKRQRRRDIQAWAALLLSIAFIALCIELGIGW